MGSIQELLLKIVAPLIKVQSLPAIVDEVDKKKETCKVHLVGDKKAVRFNCRLAAVIPDEPLETKYVAYPKVGSDVLIGILDNKDEMPFILQVSQIDEIIYQGKKITWDGLDDGLIEYNKWKEVFIGANIILGERASAQAMVLGDTLNANMGNHLTTMSVIVSALLAYVSAQSTAVASAPPLAPLAAGYTALGAALAPVSGQISAIQSALVNQLSKKSKTA